VRDFLKMTTRLNLWLAALALIFALPYYWLLVDDRPAEVEAHPLSIGQLRDLARSIPGSSPRSIRYEAIAGRLVPRTIIAAGLGIKQTRFTVRVYRLEIPDRPAIIIDSGITAAVAQRAGFRSYHPDRQALVNAELKQASLVVTLSENDLHSGGLALAGLERPSGKPRGGSACAGPRALAPGIVEIPICDDVLASRMVYVRLASGREYLLVGDVAPTADNVRYRAGPSRLFNDFVETQDRDAIHSWLRTIDRLRKEAPEMVIVPGHGNVEEKDIRRGFHT
jgi:hypothetical protein